LTLNGLISLPTIDEIPFSGPFQDWNEILHPLSNRDAEIKKQLSELTARLSRQDEFAQKIFMRETLAGIDGSEQGKRMSLKMGRWGNSPLLHMQ
jgi:hypothetical protein